MRRIVVVLLAVLMLSTPVATASQPSQPAPDQQAMQLLTQAVELEIQALDLYWTNWFKSKGWAEPWVTYRLIYPGETVRTNCSMGTISGDEDNAYYCDKDASNFNGSLNSGYIYLPMGPLLEMFLGNMWDRGTISQGNAAAIGNLAAVAIVAHEWGHHVMYDAWHQFSTRGVVLPQAPNLELFADCVAGNFMQIYETVDDLSSDEVSYILQGLALIADPEPNSGTHGTASQRQEAFSLGYYGGPQSADRCFGTYWPA